MSENIASENKEIVFDNVTFGYKPGFPVLTDYSFEARQGENVTFMGRPGADKSTIFRLITGLYSETESIVLQALKKAASGRTVLSISHRLFDIIGDEKIINML